MLITMSWGLFHSVTLPSSTQGQVVLSCLPPVSLLLQGTCSHLRLIWNTLPPVLEGFALNQDDIGLTPCAKSGSLLASSYRSREKGLVPVGTISLSQRVTRTSEAGWKSACRSAHLDKGTGSLGIRGTTGALTIKDKIGKDTIRKPRLPF